MATNAAVYPRAPLGVLANNTSVRICAALDGSGIGDFEIAGIVAEDNDFLGYLVRRMSDGTVLRARGCHPKR